MLGDFPQTLTDAIIESMDVHQSIAGEVLGQEAIHYLSKPNLSCQSSGLILLKLVHTEFIRLNTLLQ